MTAALALEFRHAAFRLLKPARRRSFLEFAEREIVLADGPKQGARFRCDTMPFSRLIFEEYDRLVYRRSFLSGPTQSGKTLLGYIIPAMYHLFEVGENVILSAPTTELAQSIYHERLLPSIRASRYEELLPKAGAGSRGGRGLAITFRNGATARFMGAGGGDHQRSSYPARVVLMSEMDKMDRAGKGSREAGPVRQIEARTTSFSEYARVYGECTMSTEEGIIHQEVMVFGTGSSVYFDCPHCGKPTPLERENFVGWQDAPDVVAARANARFICPGCTKPWTERDRRAALRAPRFVAKTQSVDDQGYVVGDPPATNTFGLRWTAGASGILTTADIGEKEFRAIDGDEEAKREIMQFTWARPYSTELLDFRKLETDGVLKKIVKIERGVAPALIEKITLAVDVGSYVCWWALVGWRADASGHVMDFGSIDVPQDRQAGRNPLAVLSALRAFRETVIAPGWLFGRQPDQIMVDSGYEHEVVYQFIQESGQGQYLACKGFGRSKRDRWHASRASTETRHIGNEWTVSLQPGGIHLVEIHSDYWKAAVHDGFGQPPGAPGSLTIFSWPPTEFNMKSFARQITAERRHVEQLPGREPITHWVVENRQNHYLDCMVYNRAAADMLGIKLIPISTPPPAQEPPETNPPKNGGTWLRTSY